MEIKNWMTNKVLFESEKTTMKKSLMEALKEKVDLLGEDLGD